LFSINLSPRQLAQPDLIEQMRSVIDETGVDPGLLELEITETSVMADPEHHIAVLHELKALGMSLAIDDFGTGYSSLSYLQRLPVDCLKIDRSFVTSLPTSQRACTLAGAIIALARAMGLKVVAEGVETEAQAEFLKASGCHEFQGFLFARPMPAQAFACAHLGGAPVEPVARTG